MQAFHNDPAIKAKYQARLAAHRAAEQLIQGTGFRNGEGCAVGCTLNDYDHSLYETKLGLPVWLAHLEDALFEALPTKEAEQFAEDFLEAIPIGVDVTQISIPLYIARLQYVGRHADAECRTAMDLAIDWFKVGRPISEGYDMLHMLDGVRGTMGSYALPMVLQTAKQSIQIGLHQHYHIVYYAADAEAAADKPEGSYKSYTARQFYWRWEADTLLTLLKGCK
jgi:hypothetical protein